MARQRREVPWLQGLVAFGVAFFVGSLALFSPLDAKKGRPLSREEVATVWVGFSSDELDLLRLDLRPDGRGSGGYAFLENEAQAFRVRWSYTPPALRIITDESDPQKTIHGELLGKVLGPDLTLTISGPGWRRDVALRREPELERRWLRVKRAMATPTM